MDDWSIERAVEAKGDQRISVCIPCRDEVATIGPLVRMLRTQLVDRYRLVDELVVLDDRSIDDTALVAQQAGATVLPIEDVHDRHGVGHGKGNALWATLAASRGDLVVWCDGDVTSVQPWWVVRLLAPLLSTAPDELVLVKALYHRPTHFGGGGRTTELVARPLLSMYLPALATLAQPLSGETAGRRSALESIPFVQGWGVEIAMLVDLAERFGAGAIGQVDLGERHHRHRELHQLSVQAAEVMATLLGRVDRTPAPAARSSPALIRSDGSTVPLNLAERPPLAGS